MISENHQDSDMTTSPADDKSSKAPIFIIGGGRSGTTLMRYMLNAHPNVYLLEEACFYSWTKGLKKNKTKYKKRIDNFLNSFSFAWLRIPRAEVTLPDDKLNSEDAMKQVFINTMKVKAASLGKTRYGEKNPMNLMFLDKLFEDFPDAKVIHMVRDPRAQVYSHKTMPFSTPSLLMACYAVKSSFRQIHEHDDKILPIRLEDLIKAPEDMMRKVLEFVEEPWSDQVLMHDQFSIPGDGIPFPWLNEAGGTRKTKKLKWKDQLSPAWIRLIEKWQKKTMERYGYEPMKFEQEPGTLAFTGAILADIPVLLKSIFQVIVVVIKLGFTDKNDTKRMQQLIHSFNPWAWDTQPEWNSELPTPPKLV